MPTKPDAPLSKGSPSIIRLWKREMADAFELPGKLRAFPQISPWLKVTRSKRVTMPKFKPPPPRKA